MDNGWSSALNQGVSNFVEDVSAFLKMWPGLYFFIVSLVTIFTVAVGIKIAAFIGGKVLSFVTGGRAGG